MAGSLPKGAHSLVPGPRAFLPPRVRDWQSGQKLRQALAITTSKLSNRADLVHVHVSVSGTSEQGVAIGAPSQADAPRDAVLRWVGGAQLIQDVLVLQVPDLDGGICCCDEPVILWAEGHAVDGAARIQRVKVLTVVDIPKHRSAVLATRCAQGAIWRNSASIDDASVSHQVGAQLAVAQVPYFDQLVPTCRHDERHLGGWREDNGADPISVHVFNDGVLALRKSVPKLDRLVATARDNLTIVTRKRNAVDILAVTLERANASASVQVPETHGLVPRARQAELAIGRQDDAGDRLTVATKKLASVANVLSIWGKLPDHNFLVAGGGDDEVSLLICGCNACHPTAMTLEDTFVLQSLSHDWKEVKVGKT